MTTLLRSRRLIFDVNSRRAALDEELRQLHDGCETAVASVCVGDDGPQKVCLCNAAATCFWCRDPLFSLLSIVK